MSIWSMALYRMMILFYEMVLIGMVELKCEIFHEDECQNSRTKNVPLMLVASYYSQAGNITL